MNQEEARPRARAAWAFSGIDQQQLAERSGIAYNRVREILRAGSRSKVTLDELYAIADATGVPRPFMDRGWDAVDQSGSVSSRDIAARLERVEEALRRGGALR